LILAGKINFALINISAMKKICLSVFMALLLFSASIFSSIAQPCYLYDTIPFAPDSLTAPQLSTITNDDQWSSILPIGFSFCFYGNDYTQFVIGANGLISFKTNYASSFCPWSQTGLGPRPINSIYMPWEDLYLPSGGTIRYQTMGTSPYRRLVVAFTNVPFFTSGICPGCYYTGHATLFESLNTIEIHVKNNSVCTAWNGGKAVIGVQDSTGTDSTLAFPDSSVNYPISNRAFRFTPVCLCPISVEELNRAESLHLNVSPNPSQQIVNVSYELKQSSGISIGIYNSLGELVAAPVQNEKQNSGAHRLSLNLNQAGIYFVKLQSGKKIVTRKFTVAK
jgi:hypothetical protein